MIAGPGPGGDEAPVFGAPWHARAFALVVALHEGGVFTWREWAAALAAEIGKRPAATDAHGRAAGHAHTDHADADHDHADHDGRGHDDMDHDEQAAPGDEYYRHWLAALEHLVEAKRVGSRRELEHLDAAWAAAAGRTPHGMAIELRAEDFSQVSEA